MDSKLGPAVAESAPCGFKPSPGDAPYSAIDLGTNNCRMLVAEPTAGGFKVIDSFSRITRLGEGLSASGHLSDDAMLRTIEALQKCREKMERRGVSHSRNVATEACRRAANCEVFLDRVERETDIALEIISADEEAKLALVGCGSLLNPNIPFGLIFDIGGGSTEVLLVELYDDGTMAVAGCQSLPLGVVTVAEDCGGGDLCSKTYEEVASRVSQMLGNFCLDHEISDKVVGQNLQIIGTAGTVTTLGGMHLGLPRYDRAKVDGMTVKFDDLRAASTRLCNMTIAERAQEPCIGWQRADLVLAGCAILEAIIRRWPVDTITIADRGLREGLLLEMMNAKRGPMLVPCK